MDKQEFLDKLRMALNGKVSAQTLSETINYYEDYINTEIRMGKAPEEVMERLGDPRLIARTIVQTNGTEDTRSDEQSGARYEQEEMTQRERQIPRVLLNMPGWVWLIVLVVLAVVVLGVLFSILSVFAPVIVVFAVVVFLVKFFRDWMN